MATAIADARDPRGEPHFDVVGVDLPTELGRERVDAINRGVFPIGSSDEELATAFGRVTTARNLTATTDDKAYQGADVVVVDVQLDVSFSDGEAEVDFSQFRAAINTLGRRMKSGSLVVVETTVPPGTCSNIVVPEIDDELRKRDLPKGAILVAHSYERVTPGDDYLGSITRQPRVYSGFTEEAADACERFYSKILDPAEASLTRLGSTTASEAAKILENSFRAVTISMMEEWGRFAEAAGFDLFPVIDAIRQRPTHSNIRQPGFGVGGYCLPKDPLLARVGARELLGLTELDFPFSERSVIVNREAPLQSVRMLRDAVGGSLQGITVALLGVSYRQGVADTRNSPSELFVRTVEGEGANVLLHDPLVESWMELGRPVMRTLGDPRLFDAVVLAVPHREYTELDYTVWLGEHRPLILDANRVLRQSQRQDLLAAGHTVVSVGRGG